LIADGSSAHRLDDLIVYPVRDALAQPALEIAVTTACGDLARHRRWSKRE
jgi:hypothetical protein